MNLQLKEAYDSVFSGWWSILDEYIPKIKAVAPDCKLMIKEKFGVLRIQPYDFTNCEYEKLNTLCDEAEVASSTVCEYCGQEGRLRDDEVWWHTLCDRCAALDYEAQRKVIAECKAEHLKKQGVSV